MDASDLTPQSSPTHLTDPAGPSLDGVRERGVGVLGGQDRREYGHSMSHPDPPTLIDVSEPSGGTDAGSRGLTFLPSGVR